jgi:hypothetical protein
MQRKHLIAALFVGILAAAVAAGAATSSSRIISLSVKVSAGGHSIGTFSVKPSQSIPTKPGVTYTLELVGTTISGGKPTTVPVDATFSIRAGNGRIVLSNPGSNKVDVKVIKTGRNGNLIKYVVAPGTNIKKGLATGYIHLT